MLNIVFRLSVQSDTGMGMGMDLEDAVDRLLTYLNTSTMGFPRNSTMYAFPNMTLGDALNLTREYLIAIKNNSVVVTNLLDMVRLLSYETKTFFLKLAIFILNTNT